MRRSPGRGPGPRLSETVPCLCLFTATGQAAACVEKAEPFRAGALIRLLSKPAQLARTHLSAKCQQTSARRVVATRSPPVTPASFPLPAETIPASLPFLFDDSLNCFSFLMQEEPHELLPQTSDPSKKPHERFSGERRGPFTPSPLHLINLSMGRSWPASPG